MKNIIMFAGARFYEPSILFNNYLYNNNRIRDSNFGYDMKKINLEYRECVKCHGYGVLDSGKKCRLCGGSGELMYDKDTGERVTLNKLIKLAKNESKTQTMSILQID